MEIGSHACHETLQLLAIDLNEWNNYCSTFKTLFIDIDGTLFFNSNQYFSPTWGLSQPIEKNIAN